MAETIPTKTMILKQSSDCIKDSQAQVCKKLFYELEKLQLLVYDQNRFKCQSSLLGMQSAIIEASLLKNISKIEGLLTKKILEKLNLILS